MVHTDLEHALHIHSASSSEDKYFMKKTSKFSDRVSISCCSLYIEDSFSRLFLEFLRTIKNFLIARESKQPNGCFSLRWTQYITASERVDVAPLSLSSLLNSLELYLELSFA